MAEFQSTLPARGATEAACILLKSRRISIHTPREGSDANHEPTAENTDYFNPHSPRGERRRGISYIVRAENFNPHSPRGERPGYRHRPASKKIFQSTLPARGATPSA